MGYAEIFHFFVVVVGVGWERFKMSYCELNVIKVQMFFYLWDRSNAFCIALSVLVPTIH